MATHFTFIVSGGRTGTQFLGDLLSLAIDDCYSEHEPDIFRRLDRDFLNKLKDFGLWDMVIGRLLGQSGIRVLGTQFLTKQCDFEAIALKLRKQRAKYHARVEKGLLVESYYTWWMVAPELREIFTNCNVIGVVRDPRHWIESWLSMDPQRAMGHWTHHFPPGPINPQTVGDHEWMREWNQFGPIPKMAWHWNFINSKILEACQSADASIFRFEDIFCQDGSRLRELCVASSKFPDQEYSVRDISHLISDVRNSSPANKKAWTNWSAQDRGLVNDICGALIQKFGYNPL